MPTNLVVDDNEAALLYTPDSNQGINANFIATGPSGISDNTYIHLENLNKYLLQALEEERLNISYLVHDELGQAMTALKMDLCSLKLFPQNSTNWKSKIDSMLSLTNQVIKKVQRISQEIHPGILKDLGLQPAIKWYCEDFESRTGISCELQMSELQFINPDIELALYRVLQEAMTNVIRHSKATKVTIQMYASEEELIFVITDNGVGVPHSILSAPNSLGMMSMQQRVKLCRGTLLYKNQINSGLSIFIKIPKFQLKNEDTNCR